jgi:hypothetical protein
MRNSKLCWVHCAPSVLVVLLKSQDLSQIQNPRHWDPRNFHLCPCRTEGHRSMLDQVRHWQCHLLFWLLATECPRGPLIIHRLGHRSHRTNSQHGCVRVTLLLAIYCQSVRLGAKPVEADDQRFFFAAEPLRSESLCNIFTDEVCLLWIGFACHRVRVL